MSSYVKFGKKRTICRYKYGYIDRYPQIGYLIDNAAPKLNIENVLKRSQAAEDQSKTCKRLNENMENMKAIDRIYRTHGFTDNYNPIANNVKSRLYIRERTFQKWDKQNIEILEDILTAKSQTDCWMSPKLLRKKPPQQQASLFQYPTIENLADRSKIRIDFEILNCINKIGRISAVINADTDREKVEKCFDQIINRKSGEQNSRLSKQQYKICNKLMQRIFPNLYIELGYSRDADNGECFFESEQPINDIGMILSIPLNSKRIVAQHIEIIVITLTPLPMLTGKCRPIGQVFKGFETLRAISALGQKPSGKPKEPLIIKGYELYGTFKDPE